MPPPKLTLNCDLGEGLDSIDLEIMPYLDLANIACGGHAGNQASMEKTVSLAIRHGVKIGAHPSYPDRQNFGRKRLKISSSALKESLLEQIASLCAVTEKLNATVHYIKPHGALYNDCTKPAIIETLIFAAQKTQLPLMLLAGNTTISNVCKQAGITLIREAFADRQYSNNGLLIARTQPNALLNNDDSLEQVRHLKARSITTSGGLNRPLQCDSLCIHSDTAGAIETAKQIRTLLDSSS